MSRLRGRAVRNRQRALTYVEVLISLVILATAVAASVGAYGSFAGGSRAWGERSTAAELANRLMSQVFTLPYADPSVSDPCAMHTIGVDSGENAANRTTFDDLDDFNGWNVTPPRDTANAEQAEYTGYREQVTVAFDTSLATATGTSISAWGAKSIRVTVYKDDRALAELVTIRTCHDANR